MKTYCEKTDENTYAIKEISPFGLQIILSSLEHLNCTVLMRDDPRVKEALNELNSLISVIKNKE